MLDIINRPDMQQYTVFFASGETLFIQGDNSQDMYLLVNGQIEVFKDDNKIADITDPGITIGKSTAEQYENEGPKTWDGFGKFNGATIQIPTTDYHTNHETTSELAIKNYYTILKRLL